MSSISQNKAVPPAPAEQSSTILRKKTDFVFKFHVLRQPPPPKSKFLPQGLAKTREAGKKKNCKKKPSRREPGTLPVLPRQPIKEPEVSARRKEDSFHRIFFLKFIEKLDKERAKESCLGPSGFGSQDNYGNGRNDGKPSFRHTGSRSY